MGNKNNIQGMGNRWPVILILKKWPALPIRIINSTLVHCNQWLVLSMMQPLEINGLAQ